MEKQSAFPIDEYLDIALRRKWLIVIPLILSAIITTIVYYRLPKIYRSDTLILVLPQNVPEEYVRSTITTPVEARLATITEEVLSRTRLETIITEFNLYPEAQEKVPMDVIVEMARKDIEIDVRKDRSLRDKSSSFKIYYKGKDPETVKRVTNKLASLFIEENLKTREQQARVTTEFLNKELGSAKEKLEAQERAITEFKFHHIGNLPEQNASNLEILRQLAERRQMINERLAKADDKALLIRQQLSGVRQLIDDEGSTSIQAQLQAAKRDLISLKGKYTENHIEVRKAMEVIRQLEERLALDEEGAEGASSESPSVIDPVIMDLKNQLMLTNKEMERLRNEEGKIKQAIEVYEKRLEESPRVELQLASLNRDYENTKSFYENLLQKKMAAEQSENLEKRQQGEQFRVLDPASLPKIPYMPNPKKVFPLGLLVGLGAGLGLVFLAETIDKSFKNEKEAEGYLNVPVLAVIPLIKKEEDSRLIACNR